MKIKISYSSNSFFDETIKSWIMLKSDFSVLYHKGDKSFEAEVSGPDHIVFCLLLDLYLSAKSQDCLSQYRIEFLE